MDGDAKMFSFRGVTKISLGLEEAMWIKRKLSNDTFYYVPKNMLEVSCEDSFQRIKSSCLPYVYVVIKGGVYVTIEASVGLVRAIPIFFSFSSGVLEVHDKPHRFKELNNVSISKLSLLEFLSFGYVTENRTLLCGIFQLQAGEVLRVEKKNGEVSSEYIYDALPIDHKSQKEQTDELGRISERVFSSLIKNLKGKIPVIPLSGGYDSRFIASMLKLGGIDKAICLSYGIPGNFESQISKKIAEKLGFEWHYIEYKTSKWKKVFQTERFDEYMRFAHVFTSVSCFQEYISTLYFDAINKSYEKPNYVFLPGHAADFVAGSHLTQSVLTAENTADIVCSILTKHYRLRKLPANNTIEFEVNRQVSEELGIVSDLFKIFELWNWRERQSKFIANANRIYDYCGYSWSLPFWNKEFADFWGKIPPALKYMKKLYDEFLENRIFSKLGVDIDREERSSRRERKLNELNSGKTSMRDKLVNAAKYNKYIYNMYRTARRKLNAPSNPCAFDTANPFLLRVAKERYFDGYRSMKRLLKTEFPTGRGRDANSYAAEYILSWVLETIGDNIRCE